MNQYNIRYLLKTDIESNWNKLAPTDNSNGFVPLAGEPIIYAPDGTHHYARLKIGNGVTNVVSLPFIDAGSVKGMNVEFVKISGKANFPAVGAQEKLYIDTKTNKMYYYNSATNKYIELFDSTLQIDTLSVNVINSWRAGTAASFTLTGHKLTITTGTAPTLSYGSQQVVTNVQEGS